MSSSSFPFLQESLEDFKKGLRSSIPLRHFSDYHDETTIKDTAKLESGRVLKTFQDKISIFKNRQRKRDLEKELLSEIQKLTEAYLIKNKECQEMFESVLKKSTDYLCEYFKSTSEAQFLLNPDMEQESVDELLETGKSSAIKKFEYHSNYGNVGLYDKHKQNLMEKLNNLGNELLENQHISKDERRSLMETKGVILEMSRLLKSEVDVAQGNIPKPDLKVKVQNIRNYLLGQEGRLLSEKYNGLFSDLRGTLENAAEFLNSSSTEDTIEWAEGLDMKLQFHFENEAELSVMLHEGKVAEVTSNEPDFTEETIKYEVQTVEMEDESFDLEIPREDLFDEDEFKIENCDGFPLNQSELGVVPGHIQDGVEENISGTEDDGSKLTFKRRRLSRNLVPEMFPVGEEEGCASSVDMENGETLSINDIQIVSGVGQTSDARKKMNGNGYKTLAQRRSNRGQPRSSKEMNGINPEKLNTAYKNGDFPLLRGLRNGRDLEVIKKMLDDGANVNIKMKKNGSNAGQEVIASLIKKSVNTTRAIEMLHLLVTRGFNLINEGDHEGITALHYAMEIKDLDERLLTWFHQNGADFNAVIKWNQDSVLLHAIVLGQPGRIIQKLLEFGANPEHVNIWWQSAIGRSVEWGNQSALDVMIDKCYVNINSGSALFSLFKNYGLDHEKSLRMLLERGADFFAKRFHGVPLVHWMTSLTVNPFPVLMKTREILPITKEIASSTLTEIVNEMGRLRKVLPSPPETENDFTQFILFLIQEKEAKLRLQLISKAEWSEEEENCRKLEKVLLTPNFVEELKTIGVKWSGDELVNRIKAAILGRNKSKNSISIETILLSLLNCGEYKGFVEMCGFLQTFCKAMIYRYVLASRS